MQKLIDNLKSDPDMAQKADNIKAAKNDETLTTILEKYGRPARLGKNDISSDDSRISSVSPRRAVVR